MRAFYFILLGIRFLTPHFPSAVYADLRILQEQQNESERKLQQARATKQKRLEQQAAMEAQLDRLKYENGQQRTELQRASVVLSRGQRQLAEARVAAEKAGEDLRDFDRKVNRCLEIKRTLQAYERKHDVMLEEIRKKLSFLEELAEEAKEQFDAAQAEYDKVKMYEESLRQSIKAEAEKQHRIAKETVDVRAALAAQENELTLSLKKEVELKRVEESLRKKLDAQRSRHASKMASLQERQEQLDRRKEKMVLEKARAKEAAQKKKQDLHQVWHRTIEIQKAEGHTSSLPPSESNVPPVLDLERIRESVLAEAAAAIEETKSKEELEPKVEALREQLPELKAELAATNKQVNELQEANEKALNFETERSKAISCMKAELEKIQKQVAVKDKKLQELHQLAKLKKELAETTTTLHERQQQLSEVLHEEKEIDAKIVELRSAYEQKKKSDDATLASKKEDLEEVKKKLRELVEKTRLIEEHNEAQKFREKIASYDRAIEKMEKGTTVGRLVADTGVLSK